MRARLPTSLLLCSVLLGCGVDPTGVYRTTDESFRRAFENTFPKDDSPATQAIRERFAGMSGEVILKLAADRSFELTWDLPPMQAKKRDTGTWEPDGDAVILTPSTSPKDGQASWTAHVLDDEISLQQSPEAPRFVLEKQVP